MTSAPAVDEREHVAAISHMIAQLVEPDTVYEWGKVPGADGNEGVLPDLYILVSVERTFHAIPQAARRPTRSRWRASIRFVGSTVREAQWLGLQITRALDGVRVDIGDRSSTPVIFETGDSPEPDDGMFSGSSDWTYSM